MSDVYVFRPPVRLGLAINGAAGILLSAVGGLGLWQLTRADIGPVFLLYLVPTLLAVGLVPVLIYRTIALQRASYTLERDGLSLRWGLRLEDIPMNTILWVRPVTELEGSLPRPWLRLPGLVLGIRRLPGAGEVEFLAASWDRLVLIATPGRIFAISPDDPEAFLRTYQRYTELGSLSPLPARSVYPAFLLARVWATLLARYLILVGAALSLILLVWVSLAIPARSQVQLGFGPTGIPRDPIPGVRLLLLPIINGIIFLADFLLGLYFFRYDASRLLAYLLWGGGALTPFLFLVSVFFILRIG